MIRRVTLLALCKVRLDRENHARTTYVMQDASPRRSVGSQHTISNM